jgi:cytochrome c553
MCSQTTTLQKPSRAIGQRTSLLGERTVLRARSVLAGVAMAGVLLAVTSAALGQTALDATTRRVAENLAVNLCATCHGPGGVGSDPKVPRIGGQQRDYIEVQLKAFRGQSRNDPDAHEYMWGIAAMLNDNVVAALADYFAAQPPGKGRSGGRDAAQIATGERLYQKGDRARGIPPCAACHGANAEGMSVFPRLAGQHAFYLGMQMEAIQGRLRQSPVMHGVIRDLTIEDIQALAYYLESL